MFRPLTLARGAAALLLAACSAAATAQVQRTFVNLGFELPSAGSSTCFFQVDESTVPGWTTNHPSQGGSGCAPLIPAGSGKLIEIWANGFNGVSARSGTQFAELNAEAASRIFQNVCLATGEPIGWRFSHRGRQSATTDDVAEFRVGSTAGTNQVVRASTQNDGGFSAPTCYNTGASSSGIANNSCTAPALSGTWRDYAGEFTWNGATGVQAIGFEAISAAGGATIGNFIDDIQVTLRPFVELSDASLSVREGASSGLPTLRVVGTVPAGGISVTLQVQSSSSATRGSDYTTAGSDDTVVVSVPAGVYDGNDIALPIALVDDAAVEDNEVLNLAIVSSPTNYVLSSTRTCGGTPILSSSVSLLDNEVDLAAALQAPATATQGSTVTLSATFANNTAAPTQGDTGARAASAAITLAQPAGLSFTSWTCSASNGAYCPGGSINASVSGSGAISGAAVLPAGNAAAGGVLSYSIQAEVTAAYCSNVALTASIATPAPLAEAGSVQSGFTTPAPGGMANNSAAASIAVACANAAPVITTTAPTQATRGEAYRYDVDATDADNDVLAYNLDTQPTGMSIDAASGLIEWTPGDDQVGSHAVSVRVSDGRGGQAVQSFTITVVAVNRAPQITSIPGTTGVTGQAYAYDVNAVDPDHDTLSYTLVQAPAGMSIDPLSGFITWTPNDSQLAAADVTVQASDPHGASDTQEFRIIVNASLIGRSHVGTEFWFTHNQNFYTATPPGVADMHIAVNDPDRRAHWVTIAALDGAQGHVEIPGLSFRQDFTLSAGEVAEIRLPWQVMNTQSFTPLAIGVHVVSDRPVTVVSTNRADATTDASVIYPVPTLGTHYTVIDYPPHSGRGGQFGLVALADNTRVTFLPPTGRKLYLPPGVPSDSAWSATLQRGQAYSASMVGEYIGPNYTTLAPYMPYSGLRIVASGPVAVFGGSLCADVPTDASHCDHLYEQLLPDRNLGQRFVAGTLATRTAGNVYRFVATEADTAVYAGNRLIAVLDRGEAVDRDLAGPVEIYSSKPIQTWLVAQSESVDSGNRTVPPGVPVAGTSHNDGDLLDPFAIALQPVGTELTDYLFTTPNVIAFQLHYADFVINTAAAASLQLDGQPVSGVDWQPFAQGNRVHGTLRLTPGRHRISAAAPFTLSVYGYGNKESYGYAGGLLIGDQDRIRQLEVTPLTQTRTVGDSACFSVVARDEQRKRVPYARFSARVGGAMPRTEARYFDGTGVGEYCFDQPVAGSTPVEISSGQATVEARVEWLAVTDGVNRAPVIVSLPQLELYDEPFRYTVAAIDPNNDALTYSLVQGPPGAQIDAATGLVQWQPPTPADRATQIHGFVVRATDPFGLYAEQIFDLRLTFPALMTPISPQEEREGSPYQGAFAVLGGVAEGLVATLIEGPPQASATLDTVERTGTVKWEQTPTAPTLRHTTHLHLGSFDGRFDSPGFATQRLWYSDTQGTNIPVFGRPLDTNGDGSVTSADRLVALGVNRSNRLVARFVDTGESLPWSGTPTALVAVVPAFVDLDADGKDEIVYASGSPSKLTAISGTQQALWTTPPAYGTSALASLVTSIESADLDGDGLPEIVAGGSVYGANGALRWSFGPSGSSVAALRSFPLISDLDGDGSPEVALFNEVRRSNGTLWWSLPSDGVSGIAFGQFAAYDVDADGDKEVFASVNSKPPGTYRLERLNSDGTRLGDPIPLTGDGGAPSLFDIDRDGAIDVYLPWERLAVAAADGRISHRGKPYGATAVTPNLLLADINRDGAVEFYNSSTVVARDLTTDWRWHTGSASYTSPGDALGLGAFVDSNGDGNAELYVGGYSNGLEVPLRGVWPIDRAGRRSFRDGEARLSGSFGLDLPPATPSNLRYDAWIGDLYLRPAPTGKVRFDVTVRNRGLRSMLQPASVSLYAGRREDGGALLAQTSVAALRSGASRLVSFDPIDEAPAQGWIYAYIDGAETTADISTHNNAISAHMLRLQISDGAGRVDRQTSSVQVIANQKTFTMTGKLPTQIYSGHEVSLQIQGASIDYDGAPFFSLSNAPAGVHIDPWSGVLSWTPTPAQAGFRGFYVNVLFFDGSTTNLYLTTTVVANPNRPPVIQSAPPTQGVAAVLWQYPVAATDPDNDTLSYALTTFPAGMSIDAQTGLIQWTPTDAQAGASASGTAHAVVLRVSDSAGNSVTQNFSVAVRKPLYAPPPITSIPPTRGKVGCLYTYAVTATAPAGATLRFGLDGLNNPKDLTVNTVTGAVSWTPTAAQVGANPVSIAAFVSGASSFQKYTINVLGAAQQLSADIRVEPAFATQGQPVTVTVEAVNAAAAATLDVSIDGAPVTLDSAGRYTFTPTRTGQYPIAVSVADGCHTAQASGNVFVSDPSDTDAPVVQLISPEDNAVVTKPTSVVGTVADTHLASWRLALKDDQGSEAFRVIASGTNTFSNAAFATLDPTLLLNGFHILVLEATDTSGRTSFDSVAVSVEGDMKVGHYSITLLDVEIPLSGIPIRVTRTYDTRRAHEDLDFGYGWTIDYQNVRVRENRRLGFSWRLAQNGGGFTPWCVKPMSDPLVTITLPDGKVEKFKARFEPECQPFTAQIYGQMVFDPVGNTHGRLQQQSFGTLRVVEQGDGSSNLVDPGDLAHPADPQLYTLTTADGLIYEIDQGFGIKTITDQTGNTLTYSRGGIRHSNGRAVGFVRDEHDRITRITLPDGEARRYEYNALGELEKTVDAAGVFYTYAYHDYPRWPHYLKQIADAASAPHLIARHEYDAQGRLTATVDANGKRIEYTHDIAGQVEVVKDRRGNATTYVYDNNGWVLSETNALGEQIVREYDDNGNELTTRDAENRVTTRTFDPRGNLLTETNPAGETVTRTYGYYNQLKTEHDAYGRQTLFNEYWFNPMLGQETAVLIRSTDGLGRTTHYGMDVCSSGCPSSGNLTSLTDASGAQRSFEYDNYGNLTQETDTRGNTTTRQYDAMGRVLRETQLRRLNGVTEELVTTHDYDAAGNLLRTTAPDGAYTERNYNPLGQLQQSHIGTAAAGHNPVSTTYYYSPDGRQIKQSIGTFGGEPSTAYDAEGNVIETTDALGRKTTMVYDAANRLIETVHPDATSGTDTDNPRTKQSYYKDGQLKTSTDERGNVTTYTYDQAGRQETVTGALGQFSQSVYDKTGRRIASIDALERTTQYVYDVAGQLTKTILPDAVADDHDDSNNLHIDYAYDPAGRKIAETDPAGRTTRYVHDGEGRLIAVVLPNPTTGDNPIGIADALARGEYPAATIAAAGVLVTRYAYDEQGNKIRQTDALSRTTSWSYDKSGRVLRRTLPLGQFELFAYTPRGLLDWRRDFNDQLTTYTYDVDNRLTTTTYADQKTLALTLDKKGRPLTLSLNGLTETRVYDERDRLGSVSWNDGQQIGYQYDKAGNRTKVTTPTRVLDFTFDELNRLKTVSEPPSVALGQSGSNRVTTYGYDDVGNRDHVIHANGTRVDYRYDRMNRLTNLTHRKGAAVLLSLGYALNPDGTRDAISEHVQQRDAQGQYVVDTNGDPVLDATRTTTYAYDTVKRLTSEIVTSSNADKARTTSWIYDKVGNRLTQTHVIPGGPTVTAKTTTTSYQYDSNDRLSTETATSNGISRLTTHRYDLNGSLTETTTPEQTTFYRYDTRNKMTQVERQIGGTLDISQYTYTADGIRRSQIQKAGTLDAKEIRYLVDPNQAYAQVIEERVGAPLAAGGQYSTLNLKTAYTYGDDLLGQYALRDANGSVLPGLPTGAGGNPLATASTFHYDGLGSTRLLTDNTGNTIDAYAYGAFGELDRQASLLKTTDQPATDYQYTGEQYDPNLSFYYLRARYMDPGSGRLVQQDEFSGVSRNPASIHKYVYGNNNPVSMVDPSGNVSIAFVVASVAVLATAAGIKLADHYLPLVDNQKKVFVDVSNMNVGGNSKAAVVSEILNMLRSAYAEFGVQFSTTDRSARRSVILGGHGGGVWGDYGKQIFRTALVWTDSIIEDGVPHITRRRKEKKLTDTELGIAIGNFTVHEVGHTYGLDHIPRASYLTQEQQPLTIMDDNQLPEAMRLPWAAKSLAFLRERFR